MTDRNQRIAELLGWTVSGEETHYWVSPDGVAKDPPNFLAPENLHLLMPIFIDTCKKQALDWSITKDAVTLHDPTTYEELTSFHYKDEKGRSQALALAIEEAV